MPELAEVATLCRQIDGYLQSTTFAAATVLDERSTKGATEADFAPLANRAFVGTLRHGKFFALDFDGNDVIAIHLRMSGLVLAEPAALPRHAKVELDFATTHGPRRLVFSDTRVFGYCQPMTRAQWQRVCAALGPDALDAFDAARLAAILPRRRSPLKAVLLDQSVLAGLGNIYADEVSHVAGLDPTTPACSLGRGDVDALVSAVPQVLDAAIEHRGTALADEGWRDLFDDVGGHGPHLRVHARSECATCQGPVARVKVSGRSTYFCPRCQPPRPRRGP